MLPSEVIEAAMATIPTAAQWTQNALARDADGRAVGEQDPTACRWSLLGAVTLAEVAAGRTDNCGAYGALIAECGLRHQMTPYHYNDATDRTHAEVIAVMAAARDALLEAGR